MSDPAATPADKATPTGKPVHNLPPRGLDSKFGLESFKYNNWAYDLEEPFTFEDVMNPAFWSTLAPKLMGHDRTNPRGRGDTITVRELRTNTYRKFLVIEIGTGFVKLIPMEGARPADVEAPAKSALTTRWNNSKKMHEVIRKDDGEVLASDFQQKQGAIDWIAKNAPTMAA